MAPTAGEQKLLVRIAGRQERANVLVHEVGLEFAMGTVGVHELLEVQRKVLRVANLFVQRHRCRDGALQYLQRK